MGFVGADSGGVLDVATLPGAIAVGLAALMAVAMGWLATTTRPRRVKPAAATIELRPERPAVVDLLTGGFDVDDDAVPATVVDLAARGWFTIEDAGGERIVMRVRQRRPAGDTLNDYERRVLEHIERHAVDGVVPAPVLTLGPQGVSRRWVRAFAREVTADCRAQGLCRRRWDPVHLTAAWVLVGLAIAPGAAVAGFAERTDDPTGWASIGNLLLLVSFVIGALLVVVAARISGSDAQAETAAGLEAAAHWMGVRTSFRELGRFADKGAPSVAIWDRNLAYATALGLAPVVERQLPFETEHDKHAWSRATGQWRRVRVRYRSLRPGNGRHPALVAFLALLQTGFFAAIVYAGYYLAGVEDELVDLAADDRRRIGLVGLGLAAVAAVLGAYSAVKLLLALSDLFARRTVEGEVVRKRAYAGARVLPRFLQWLAVGGNVQLTRWYLAVDTGRDDRVQAFSVRPMIHSQVEQGARVRATYTPRLRYVRAVEVLAPPHGTLADEPQRLDALDAIAGLETPLPPGLAAPVAVDPAAAGTPLLGQILDTLTGHGRPDLERPPEPGHPDVDEH